ncbi:MAG: hypothetical protein JSR70_08965 [Proteobacteria bacterium]|nr:hypothetical protein [Pseudomonadota bacterium]
MKQILVLAVSMIAAAPVLAAGNGQSDSTTAKALDLSVPAQTNYSYAPTDPRGTYDPAKRFATPYVATQAQPVDTCDGKPHGSATVGVGYSSRMGNSNFQAAQLNTCKRYYDDNGNAHEVGVSIGIGQSNVGPGHPRRGWAGRGW